MSKAIYMPVFTPFRVSQVALVIKNLSANAGDIRDTGSIPRSGRSPEERHGNSLWCSWPENPMDWGAWWVIVNKVSKGQTKLKPLSRHAHCLEVEDWHYWYCFLCVIGWGIEKEDRKYYFEGSWCCLFSLTVYKICVSRVTEENNIKGTSDIKNSEIVCILLLKSKKDDIHHPSFSISISKMLSFPF